jgi:surfeit locus 1 family protein
MTVAALLAFGVTASLGRWQLSRAAQKEALQANIEAQARLPPLTQAELLALVKHPTTVHRKVTLRGQWLADQSVWLDNRQMNDKPGFYVLTPLRLEGASDVVLVQRGWAARNFLDRNVLPVVATPAGAVQIQGQIALPPGKLYQFGDAGKGLIRQNLDLAEFSAESGLPLLPVSVLQTDAASDGLLREWPAVGSGSGKNYGYAFQWFGLSALIALLYVWFQIGKRYVARR